MKRTMIALAALCAGLGAANADVTYGSDVTFDENGAVAMSLTGSAGNPEEGADIVGNKKKGNCVACHSGEALAHVPFHGEVGPSLDGAGSRWSEAELRGILVDAKVIFTEDTVMPSFHKTSGFVRPGDRFTGKAGTEPLPPLLSAQQIEDVVAYLMTLKDE